MIPLSITLNLDIDPWVDLDRDVVMPAHLQRVGLLPDGGQVIVAETTLRLFLAAARALAASPVAELDMLIEGES